MSMTLLEHNKIISNPFPSSILYDNTKIRLRCKARHIRSSQGRSKPTEQITQRLQHARPHSWILSVRLRAIFLAFIVTRTRESKKDCFGGLYSKIWTSEFWILRDWDDLRSYLDLHYGHTDFMIQLFSGYLRFQSWEGSKLFFALWLSLKKAMLICLQLRIPPLQLQISNRQGKLAQEH